MIRKASKCRKLLHPKILIMKFLIQLIIIIVLTIGLQLFLPWWSAGIAGILGGFMFYHKSYVSFLLGFIAVFSVWAVYAFWLDVQNASVLSSKIAMLFQVQKPMILLLVSAVIGGITGGLGSWVGSEARKLKSG
jgi:hypothetical protein